MGEQELDWEIFVQEDCLDDSSVVRFVELEEAFGLAAPIADFENPSNGGMFCWMVFSVKSCYQAMFNLVSL